MSKTVSHTGGESIITRRRVLTLTMAMASMTAPVIVMDRRQALEWLAGDGARTPTDDRVLNAFAMAYNAYVGKLREGVVDVRLWERTAEAWRRMAT